MEENKFVPLPKRLEEIENSQKSIIKFLLAKESGVEDDIEDSRLELEKIIN